MSEQDAQEAREQSGTPQEGGPQSVTSSLPPGTITGGSFFTGVPAFIVSGFKDHFPLASNANVVVDVARLEIPLGICSIWAKLYVGVPRPQGFAATLQFRLVAEGDVDQTIVTHDGVTPFVSVGLNVVHTFTSGGFATLTAEYLFQEVTLI